LNHKDAENAEEGGRERYLIRKNRAFFRGKGNINREKLG
jgi:hypothetical protein